MNWNERPHRGRDLVLIAGMGGGPAVVVTGYLVLAYCVSAPSNLWGFGLAVATLVGISAGLVCIAQLSDPMPVRLILGVLYVPASFGVLLLLWAFTEWVSSTGQVP